MSSLPSNLRRQLESAIRQARKIAEGGARKALEALAVHEKDPYQHMNEVQRDLRRKLRAQSRQLGDGESPTRRGAYEIKHLAEKLAYDQWHRLLFARFLLENHLLISPDHGVSVSLDDCEELAPSFGLKDAWAVAARFAATELPEIFRADDPAGAVELPLEDRKPLVQKVTGLPVEVFTASDSLGWCYQFWQAERKEEVNAAGNKIGADELPAVTQLFTEDYMVDFLLDNTLGAWHAGKVLLTKPALAATAESEEELRTAVALPGCPWNYLRFIKNENGEWVPAAGTFADWPKAAKEITCLDPCMGSGHFVVAIFERLVALRMAEEGLAETEAVAAVIRENLFGLEIDPRCTQIAAFNVALAAWRRVGSRRLPAMHLACSGLAPNATQEDWSKLAGDNYRWQNGMEMLYQLFQAAPVLGSLINPRAGEGSLLVAAFHELQPLLERALIQEVKDDAAHEMAVTAQGVAKAAAILAGQFTLVATNVPYLGRSKQNETLAEYCASFHSTARAELATCFIERCLQLCSKSGSAALVTPQNWLFLRTYKSFRKACLSLRSWNLVARLGPAAFRDMNWWAANTALLVLGNTLPEAQQLFGGFDVSATRDAQVKSDWLRMRPGRFVSQAQQLARPDFIIAISEQDGIGTLADHVTIAKGICTGDRDRFVRQFWELPANTPDQWSWFRTAVSECGMTGGCENILFWQNGRGIFVDFVKERLGGNTGAWIRGEDVWNQRGIAIGRMRNLPCTLYAGELFDDNSAVVIPKNPDFLPSLWHFVNSLNFRASLRELNQKVSADNTYFAAIPFDADSWSQHKSSTITELRMSTADPTQWLFNGRPKESGQPLHVAIARLLGYQWPRQTGSSFPDSPAVGADSLEPLADVDGIVCLSATKGEAPAAERLRRLLVSAFGEFDLRALIDSAGPKGSKSETLEEWLRDEFFEQHCALFHHQPFLWHIWDGHKSGFSALVNYHRLTHANLENLTYAYLGDWIRRQ